MWQAQFKDGKIIDEIEMCNGVEIENSFSVVIRNIENLVTLSILHKSKMFSVHMADSKFTISQSGIPFDFYAIDRETIGSQKLTNIRPIYFIRETVNFGPQLTPSGNPTEIFTALGFQGNIGELNIKRYLSISPNGTFTIEDK